MKEGNSFSEVSITDCFLQDNFAIALTYFF